MDKGKLILNIFITIMTLGIFVLALESLYHVRLIESFAFLALVVVLILFFFKLNMDYFDTSKDVLSLE